MTALCGSCHERPARFNVRRAYSFGVGPWESVCALCAPPRSACAVRLDFYTTADKSDEAVAEPGTRAAA